MFRFSFDFPMEIPKSDLRQFRLYLTFPQAGVLQGFKLPFALWNLE